MNDLAWLCDEVARAFDTPISWIGFIRLSKPTRHEDLERSIARWAIGVTP